MKNWWLISFYRLGSRGSERELSKGRIPAATVAFCSRALSLPHGTPSTPSPCPQHLQDTWLSIQHPLPCTVIICAHIFSPLLSSLWGPGVGCVYPSIPHKEHSFWLTVGSCFTVVELQDRRALAFHQKSIRTYLESPQTLNVVTLF